MVCSLSWRVLERVADSADFMSRYEAYRKGLECLERWDAICLRVVGLYYTHLIAVTPTDVRRLVLAEGRRRNLELLPIEIA